VISVVIPARNAARHIGDQLTALASQSYDGEWEVVVADNGSRDETRQRVAAAGGGLPEVRVVDAGARPGINRARNAGARAARGSVLLFCDADDRVEPAWVAAMVRALDDAEGAGGRLRRERPDAAFTSGLLHWPGFLPFASGANCGVRAEVFHAIGAFDERFAGGGDDVDFFWRLQLGGHRLVFAPDAVVDYRERPTARGLAAQAFRHGYRDPLLYRVFRGQGMPPSSATVAAKAWARLVLDARPSADRREWARRAGRRAGRIAGSVRYGVRYL
jgi:GT2 family glycosyltransferase